MRRQLPQQLTFMPPEFNFEVDHINHHENRTISNEDIRVQQFSAEDREHLKNAFRYICRLIFKQSQHFHDKIRQIAFELGIDNFDKNSCHKLFEGAEQISGQRYFRKYLTKFNERDQQLICRYMRWFLIDKYVKYLGCQGKGKRKLMKKQLYIKFKNEVMIPYLDSFLL